MSVRLESSVDSAFVRAVRREWPRAMVIKLGGSGLRGLPDRLVLLPSGRAVFVELKRPGGRARRLQLHMRSKIQSLGFDAAVFDNAEDAIAWLNSLR